MNPWKVRSVALCALLTVASAARAATITGSVVGPDGEPFRAAFVSAQNLKTHITTHVLSQNDGRYKIDNLPAGTYDMKIRAVGYKSDQHPVVDLNGQASATAGFILQRATVLWSDLSIYQGQVLLPPLPGKRLLLTDGTTLIRDSPCQICHSFQVKMAPYVRDEAGWRQKVDYMRNSIKCCGGRETGVSDADAEVLVKYLTSLWGPNSILPASPASDPRYKATVRPITDEALNIVYVEYDLPGPHRMPWSAVPDGKGNVWLPYKSSSSSIARVNIETGDVKEYRVPYKGIAQIHTVFPAPDGTVWAGETGGGNALVRWDPKTEQMEEFPDVSGKHTVRVRQDGMICVTGRITLFDPKTKEYTHFDERAFAYGTMFDKEGNCWFTEYDKTGKLGKIDLKTKQLKTWIPPSSKDGKQVYSRRIDMDRNGNFWIAQSEAGQIARFDPKTETFKEFPLPGPAPTPYAMNLDKDEFIWYSSEYTDMFGRMDPNTGKTVEYPFPHSEAFSREFFLDAQGRNWYATPSNNKVGYFYLAK